MTFTFVECVRTTIIFCWFFFFNDPATTEIYTYGHTLSLHDALPIYRVRRGAGPSVAGRPLQRRLCAVAARDRRCRGPGRRRDRRCAAARRSEEHTSELQSLMRISYAVFCLKKKISNIQRQHDKYSQKTRK